MTRSRLRLRRSPMQTFATKKLLSSQARLAPQDTEMSLRMQLPSFVRAVWTELMRVE